MPKKTLDHYVSLLKNENELSDREKTRIKQELKYNNKEIGEFSKTLARSFMTDPQSAGAINPNEKFRDSNYSWNLLDKSKQDNLIRLIKGRNFKITTIIVAEVQTVIMPIHDPRKAQKQKKASIHCQLSY